MNAPNDALCAVAGNTDLRRHAQLLQRTHEAMLGGAALPSTPRGVVTRSWDRMRASGRDADRIGRIDHVTLAEVESRRRRSALGGVIEGLEDSLTQVADDTELLMVVTDADGMILWRAGSRAVRRRADGVGFSDGALWTEQTVGTNAIGTALVEEAPVQLFSAEHYTRPLHT